MLGNSNIGKSTLVQYLDTEEFNNTTISTHGVEYRKILKNDITYHIWDFGGQEYFHATHKLFFSANALNIILWGNDVQRNAIEQINTFSLKYWLRTIEQLIKANRKEEVIVAENKIDLNTPKYSSTPINQAKFATTFETLHLNYTAISLQDCKGLENFKELIKTSSEKIINNFSYPAFYQVFWKRIDQLNKDFVTIDEINNRPHKDNAIAAIEVFHKMGMLLYFPNVIPDKVFVKPQILLNLIYNTILKDTSKEKISLMEIYFLTKDDPLQIPVEKIIKLLKEFKLIFEIDVEKNMFFIPQYLKPQSPWISELQEASFKHKSIIIEADNFLMGQAMLEIFSQYGNYVIGKESKEYRFWNNGIFIKKDEKILLIKFLRESQLIEIYEDIKEENFSLQKEVVDFILDLPETIYAEKRHIKNHAKRRFIEVLDMEHEDYSPHLMERLEDEGAYHEFVNKGYNTKVNWSSKYFSVFVSVDGKHFVNWEQLNKDKDLLEIKANSNDGSCIILEVAELKKFIDIKRNKMENRKEEENQIGNIQFNAPVTIGSLGNGNTVYFENQDSKIPSSNSADQKSEETAIKKEKKKTLTTSEQKAVRNWKAKALVILIIFSIITIIFLLAYFNEWDYIMPADKWREIKAKDWVKIIGTVSLVIWNGFPIKMIYDRFFDPSKENSFIDLCRKKIINLN